MLFEYSAHVIRGIVAQLENEDAAISQQFTRLFDEPPVHFNTRAPAEERLMRFVIADFALQLRRVIERNIRRIANNQIEMRFVRREGARRMPLPYDHWIGVLKSVEQVTLQKMDAVGDAVMLGVPPRNFQGQRRNIGRIHIRMGQFAGERDSQAPRASANIGHA